MPADPGGIRPRLNTIDFEKIGVCAHAARRYHGPRIPGYDFSEYPLLLLANLEIVNKVIVPEQLLQRLRQTHLFLNEIGCSGMAMSNAELGYAAWKDLDCYEENQRVAFHARAGKEDGAFGSPTAFISIWETTFQELLVSFSEDYFSRERRTRAEDGIGTPIRTNQLGYHLCMRYIVFVYLQNIPCFGLAELEAYESIQEQDHCDLETACQVHSDGHQINARSKHEG
jgi:hypothetical protein